MNPCRFLSFVSAGVLCVVLGGCVQIIPVPVYATEPAPAPALEPAPTAPESTKGHVTEREPAPDDAAVITQQDYVVVKADVAALALGENHTCSLSNGGQVRCWGYNKQGSLGVGTTKHPADGIVLGIGGNSGARVRTLVAGGYQTCALTTDGRVWCWGANHVGQVGNGRPSQSPVTTPHRVQGLAGVRSIHAGDSTTCAISGAGEVFCWGDNSHGQIDNSNRKKLATPTRLAGIDRAEFVAIGNYHLCVLIAGRIRCRGSRSALHPDGATLTNVSAIAAGYQHTCALKDGSAYCWGSNTNGVLGLGDPCGNRPPSKQFEGGVRICDTTLSIANRGLTKVSGIAGRATQIVGLDYHSCVLLQSGKVVCWGNNQGHSFSARRLARTGRMPTTLAGVDGADAVYVGGVHTCFVRAGVATCRGNNWAGAVRGPAR